MKTITILLIEDNTQDIRLINEMLKEIRSFNYNLVSTATLKDGCEQIQKNNFDIILLDLNLPDSAGQQTFQKVIDLCKEIPVVLVTGNEDQELSVKLIMEGAQDYITKQSLNSSPLEKSILYSIERQALLSNIKLKNTQIDRIEKELILLAKFPSQNPGPVLRIAGNRKLLYINEAGIKLLPDWQLIINETIPSRLKDIIDPVFIEGTNIEFELAHREFIYSFYAVPLFEEGYINLYGRDITERKQAEEALRESEQRMNFHVNNSPLATIEWNTDFVVTRWSGEAEKIFGWNQSETIGKPIMDFPIIYDEDIPIVQKTMERLSDGSSKHVVSANRNYTKSKKVIYCEWYNSVLLSPQGKMISVMSQVMDITERKQAEDALIKSEEKFRDMVEQINDVIFTTDTNGIFTYLSPAVEILGGYKPEDMIGHFIGEFLDPLFVPMIIEKFQKVMTGILEPMEYRVKVKSGDYRWVRSSSKPILMENIPTGIRGVLSGITERKRAEEELRESYAFSESLLKTIPFGMDIVDEEGTVLFQSDNFKSLFGAKSIGKKCWELYRDNKTQCDDCPLLRGITCGDTGTYESHSFLGNRTFEIIHTGMIYEGKKAILEIFHDITDKKEKEQELIKAKEHAEESDRLKSAFLANMSHEIRTPMNGILGFADLLKEPDLTGEQQQEYIRIIEKSGARMLNIINEIIDISRIESGEIKTSISSFDIKKKLNYIFDFFINEAEQKGLQLIYNHNLSLTDTRIKTDAPKLDAILLNLIKNAIKFTWSGTVEFGCEKLGNYFQFYIKDTGVGIDAEQQEIIFDRFRQASESLSRPYEGAGLGLSISKAYVEILGGRIWVESEIGKGSVFYFTLPCNMETTEKVFDQKIFVAEKGANLRKEIKMLIAEDDDISMNYIEVISNIFCKELLKARTGVEAIETFRKNQDIDLILMDMKMPIMDGYEATRQIRQINKRVIIIAQTAYSLVGDKEKAIEAGCNGYITKPINKDDLLALIQKHFNKQLVAN